MLMERIQENIIKIIREQFLIESAIEKDDVLVEIGIDSMKMIQLIVELETLYDIEFEDDKLSYNVLRNIEDISGYIYEKIS